MVNNEDVSDHDMGRDFIVYKCINYIKLIWIYLIIQIYTYDKVINKITAWDGIALGHLSSRDIPQLIEQVIVTLNIIS